MRRLWHLPWLLCSFVASIAIISALDPFAGMGTDMLVATLLCAIGISHIVAGIVGAFLFNPSWRRCAIVLSISLVPVMIFSFSKLRGAYYLRYQAVYDRFRDNLAEPIPKTVRKLHFNPLSETINPDLSFSFDIDSKDAREIIAAKSLQLVAPEKLLCPDDYFKHPYYLPIQGGYFLYQGRDKAGDVLTLKVAEGYNHVIFRRESEQVYKYPKPQQSPEIVKMDQDALEKLRLKWIDKAGGATNRSHPIYFETNSPTGH